MSAVEPQAADEPTPQPGDQPTNTPVPQFTPLGAAGVGVCEGDVCVMPEPADG